MLQARRSTPTLILGAAALAAACSQPTAPPRDADVTDPDASCETTPPIQIGVGAVAPYWGVNSSVLCFEGGSNGTEYLVVASNAATAASTRVPLRATALGVQAPQVPLAMQLPAAAGVAVATPLETHGHARNGVHDRVRRLEREQLTPLMEDARSGLRSAQAALSIAAAVPAVGSLRAYNVNTQSACTNPDWRTGRVMAISERAILVADTANPANGFTTSDFQALGAVFDTLVAPVITDAFGEPTDIDGNGRVIIFYTRAVNELTPSNVDFVAGGFVFARDLYPQQSEPGGPAACAGSNMAEMFYMLAPDPSGEVNGNVRTVEYVRRTTVGTLAHEYQHLINASRRLYITRASAFELVWLDEGLAHIAEELLFRRAAGVGGGSNLGGPEITQSQRRVDAFNQYQSANVGRFEVFARAPEGSSPVAPNDSLSTRGATRHLLRYAADQNGGDEEAIWRSLAEGPATGTANLASVFGNDLQRLLAEWHVAVGADDAVDNLAPAFTFPSWNLRSIYVALQRDFPLRVRVLADDVPAEANLAGGGSAYFRIGVPAGGKASLRLARSDGGALPTTYATSVIRTR